MKSIEKWLSEYGESHRHPVIHKIGVPAIVCGLLALFSLVSVGSIVEIIPISRLNLAHLICFIVLIYYAMLSFKLALGMSFFSFSMLYAIDILSQDFNISLFFPSITLFVSAWILQFIGHKIEGKRPSFFQDLQFLLIGPLWTLSFLYKRIGISIK